MQEFVKNNMNYYGDFLNYNTLDITLGKDNINDIYHVLTSD